MAARRPHPKSKLGCADCKRRRIKCDENRPDCDNCRRRGTVCSFHRFDPVVKPSKLSVMTTAKVSSHFHIFLQGPDNAPYSLPGHGLLDPRVQLDLLQQFPETVRPRFLEILRHFTAYTIPMLGFGDAVQAAWRQALAVLAASNKFVVHGILAVGSLHLARLAGTVHDRETYDDIAAKEMNAGMKQYRTEIQNVTTKNAEALFAFSTTLTTFVLLTAGTECEAELRSIGADNTSTKDRTATISTLSHAICRILRTIRGVLVIIVPCWNQIQTGILRLIIERGSWPPSIPITLEEIHVDQKLQQLETMWGRPGRVYEYTFDTLRQTLGRLRESFALVSRLISLAPFDDTSFVQCFDWTSVIHWPVHLGVEFITLLEQRCWEAWVLMAHYAMLPAKVTGIIWLDSLARNLVATAALVIGEEHWEWIAWPASAVKVDLEYLRDPSYVSPDKVITRQT